MLSAFFPAQQQDAKAQDRAAAASSVGSDPIKRVIVTQTASPAKAHASPGSISQPAVGSSRALRFPSSRRYLWDRTAAGPQVLVEVLDYLPHVQVAASTFGAISRASSSKAGSLTLQLRLSVSNTNQVTVLVEEHDPLRARDALQLSCAMQGAGAAAHDAASSLRAAVQAHLDQRDIARVQQLYALSATAAAAASPADPTCLRLQLLMPCAGLLATPLYTKRLCHVPLAEALLKPGCMAAGQTGYLSMDQARSLLPLKATDANVYSTPLVGVWVKGPSSVLHPLVAAACLRFAYSSLLMDRAVNPEDGAFLLLLCPEGDPVSKCFEVCGTDSSALELSCYRLEAGVRPAGGTSQFPGGVVSATWVPEQGQVQSLPGTLRPGTSSSGSGSRGLGLLTAGMGTGRHAAAAGSPARAAGGCQLSGRGHQQDPTLPAFSGLTDSPVRHGHGSHLSHVSKAGLLPGGRLSAPSAAFSYGAAAGQLQRDAAAAATAASARRSLPLARYVAAAEGTGHRSWGTVGAGPGGLPFDAAAAAAAAAAGMPGQAIWPGEDPQPRSGMPAAPYMPSTQAGGSSQAWQQHQQQQEGYEREQRVPQAAAPEPQPSASPVARQQHAAAAGGASSGGGSSPSRSFWQQQQQQQLMSWSDRQDQVLRSSLEGAAEALRVSQVSLAAAREAASGANGSPSPGKKTPGTATPVAAAGAAGDLNVVPEAHSPGAAGAVAAPASPQPPLSRLGQQQQQSVSHGAEGGSPRMGSPVRMGLQKKASMLAAAAAHAAGLASPAAAPADDENAAAATDAAGTADAAAAPEGGGVAVPERPVSPAVQAGLALSNLSLLQHLSSGHLQQALAHSPSPRSHAQQQQQQYTQQDEQVLEAVRHEAVAAAAAGAPAAAATATEHTQQQPHSLPASGPLPPADAAAAAPAAGRLPVEGMLRHTGTVTGHPAVIDSLNASHAAAAAIRTASGSMQRVPVHPYYMGQSLGVQRYACDVAVMHSSQGSPQGTHAWGMLSPGSTPGAHGSRDTAPNMQPPPLLQQPGVQQTIQQQQYRQAPGGVPPAWSPQATAAAMPGALVSSSMAASPYWQQQPQQQQQLVSPVSGGGLSPGWVPDPVAQALQGEVDRLRQQLMQLQHQLRLAGMSLRGPELEPAAFAASPQALMASPPPGAMPGGSPGPAVHIAHVSLQPQQPVEPQGQYVGGGGVEQGPADWGATAAAAAAAAAAGSAAAVAYAQQQQQVDQQAAVPQTSAAPAAGDTGAAAAPPAAADDHAKQAAAVAPPPAQQQSSGGADAAQPAAGPAAVQDASVPVTSAAAAQSTAAPAERHPESAVQQKQQRDKQQQEAAAAAPRQRRRRLMFNAAAHLEFGDAAQEPASAGAISGSGSSSNGGSRSSSRTSTREDAECVAVEEPVVCSSPAVARAVGGAAAAAVAAGGAYGARGSTQGGLWRSSAARSSGGGGLGPLRVSLDVPPLVEVVRARLVDLSDDSDSEEWEDRLMAKYGLK